MAPNSPSNASRQFTSPHRRHSPRLIVPFLLTVLLTTVGCNNNEAQQEPPESGAAAPVTAALTLCTEPRPEFCTMDYNPVCGSLDGGGTKTYSNGCSACSDSAVTGWIAGACE